MKKVLFKKTRSMNRYTGAQNPFYNLQRNFRKEIPGLSLAYKLQISHIFQQLEK
jgi:hypothetical protein